MFGIHWVASHTFEFFYVQYFCRTIKGDLIHHLPPAHPLPLPATDANAVLLCNQDRFCQPCTDTVGAEWTVASRIRPEPSSSHARARGRATFPGEPQLPSRERPQARRRRMRSALRRHCRRRWCQAGGRSGSGDRECGGCWRAVRSRSQPLRSILCPFALSC